MKRERVIDFDKLCSPEWQGKGYLPTKDKPMTALEQFVYMLDWHDVDYVLVELDHGTTIVAMGRMYVFSKDGRALAMNVEGES